MNSKDEILGRLYQSAKPDHEYRPSHWADKTFFADYPKDSDDLINVFREQLKKLFGELHILNNINEAGDRLLLILKDVDTHLCGTHQFSLFEKMKAVCPDLNKHSNEINGIDIKSEEYAKYEVGITGADFLIARTGSILLRTITAGGRRLSILPPTHIVIAEEKQLVFSLDDALQNLDDKNNLWSYATIITGPSRTSDIEKELVLGAHGPKRLVVLLIRD
jgi:L-lactate dehydrogenase complex protein LldG